MTKKAYNIYLDVELKKRLDELIGNRKISPFINAVVTEFLDYIEDALKLHCPVYENFVRDYFKCFVLEYNGKRNP